MKSNQLIWRNWVSVLHSWGFHEIAATLLEATGPLNFIGAQVIYLTQPFLNVFLPGELVEAFAELLGNPVETENFVESLRHRS